MKINFELNIKKLAWPSLAAGTLFAGCFFVSPYLTIYSFRNALESNNPNDAVKYIDFPSIRSSLKNQIKIGLGKKILNDYSSNALTLLGLAIVNPLIDGVIDNSVTPSGLKVLFYEGELSKGRLQTDVTTKTKSKPTQSSKSDEFSNRPNFEYHYRTYNSFVTSSYFDNTKDRVVGIWQRKGLFQWQLISVELPAGIWKFD